METVGRYISTFLDHDFLLELSRRGQKLLVPVDVPGVEHVPEDVREVFGHLVLLPLRAMVLDGEDQRELRGEEGVGLHRVDQDLFEVQLGRQRPAVVDDRLRAGTVPAVWKK